MNWNLKEKNLNWQIVGLTGGIASGKSTVGRILASNGAALIDCDQVYHQLLNESAELHHELIAAFGTANRHKLGQIVFNHPEQLPLLNQITHPFIAKGLINRIEETQKGQTIVIEATLLFESGLGQELKENVAVISPLEVRISRLMTRNNLSYEEALSRINAQSDDNFRQKQASMIINNLGTFDELKTATDNVWNILCRKNG